MGDLWPLHGEWVDCEPTLCPAGLWLWGVFHMTLSRVLSPAELQHRGSLLTHARISFPSLPRSSCSPGSPVSGSAVLGAGSVLLPRIQLLLTALAAPLQKYVQDILQEQLAEPVYRALQEQGGHIYVCGDVTMAADVLKAIQRIMTQQGKLSAEDAGVFISRLRVSGLLDPFLSIRFLSPLPHPTCLSD